MKTEHFDFFLARINKNSDTKKLITSKSSLNDVTSEVEKDKIIRVLAEIKGNKSAAAKLLEIGRSILQ